jgi:outer membrane protein OmpA-like peptidoglycan-associated protein
LIKKQIINLFLLGLLTSCGSIITPKSNFLADSKVSPSKLEFFRDSIQFEVSGIIPIESFMSPKNPQVSLHFVSRENSMDLGKLSLIKNFEAYRYSKSFKIAYEPWMEFAIMELHFNQGGNPSIIPQEKKQLARGVITTALLAKVGQVFADEPIPDVGLYIPSGVATIDQSRLETFNIFFQTGSSEINLTGSNYTTLAELGEFITQNPSIKSIKITGVQSPEVGEGKSSALGDRRSKSVYDFLLKSGFILKDSITEVKSRWNDWFDLRLLLRDYDKISIQQKDQYYKILLNGLEYSYQLKQLNGIVGYDQVANNLFPRLRTAKIEVQVNLRAGLNQKQTLALKRVLDGGIGDEDLGLFEWSQAGEFAPRLKDKAEIYAKMTELFRSALPYNNLAVVRMKEAQQTLDIVEKEKLWDEATWLLNQAAKLETSPYVLHNQGQILLFRGEYWDAYKKLSYASVLTKNEHFLKINEGLRGALDIVRGDYRLATLRFESSYSDAKNLFNKGLASFLAKDYVKANLAFEESVIAQRDYGYGFYGLAMIAMETGQKEVAMIQLQKAVAVSENLYQKALSDPFFDKIRSDPGYFQLLKRKE